MPQLEHVLDALHELHPVDRLGEEVVGARLNGPLDIAELAKRRHHQDHDRARRRVGLEPLTDLKAGELWHHDVEEDDVGVELRHLVEGVLAVNRGGDVALDVGEIDLEELAVGLVVVGDQHAAAAR